MMMALLFLHRTTAVVSILKRPVAWGSCNYSHSYSQGRRRQPSSPPRQRLFSTTHSPPRRTHAVFPWRHETHPPPRLIPGTIEHQEAPAMSLTPTGRKWVSYGFLQIPLWDVLFGQRRFETELAASAAYAFGQAVAGIASHVYQIPFAKTQVSEGGSVQFTYDPTQSVMEDAVGDAAKGVAGAMPPVFKRKQRRRRPRSLVIRRSWAKRPIPRSTWMYATHKFSSGKTCRRAPRPLVMKQMKQQKLARRKGNARTRVGGGRLSNQSVVGSSATRHNATSSTSNDGDESSGPFGTYCSNITDMVSPQLLALFTSAYSSAGKADPPATSTIHLSMEPLKGHLISMTALPFCSRRMAREDPATFRAWRELYPGKVNAASLRTVEQLVSTALEREGRLELTTEIQVLVPCWEHFYVATTTASSSDKQASTLLQGKRDKAQQVTHLVRLEATTEIGYNDTEKKERGSDNDIYIKTSDWIVTDIDDLVSHKTWYHL